MTTAAHFVTVTGQILTAAHVEVDTPGVVLDL
jgi:hypothetical protein